MSESTIELGPLRLRAASGEDLEQVLSGLMRFLTNQEVADRLGVSERTVRRWRADGTLPTTKGEKITVLDLLVYVATRNDRYTVTPAGRVALHGGA